jgi:hypothetical protein
MLEQALTVPRSERGRWLRNRHFYRGNQWVQVNLTNNQVRVRSYATGNRRKRETVNRARTMLDGHVALMSTGKPIYEVVPPNKDQESIDAARFAKKYVDAMWSAGGWDIENVRRDLARGGAIDGIRWVSVLFDKDKKEKVKIPVYPNGEPITDRAELESLQAQDPQGYVLWRYDEIRAGEVCIDVLAPGRVLPDPFATESFDDARWVILQHVWPRDKVEREAKRDIKEIIKESSTRSGIPDWANEEPQDVLVEDADGQTRLMNAKDAVVVYELFATPHGDWPQGAHCRWIKQAPESPMMAEPWDDELPVRPYVPRKDEGHYLKSHGFMDDLAPLQVYLNRVVTMVREWMDKLGRIPVLMPIGSLRDGELYNEKGFAEYHPTGAPHFFPTPAEPAAMLTTHIQWIIDQMSEIVSLTNPARGTPPGQGVEAAAGINLLIQQTEQQMGTVDAQLRGVLEWCVSRALKLTEKHYVIPRLVDAPGIDSDLEFDAFVGRKLRGCNHFRITSPLMPKSRAAQIQTLMQLLPMIGGDIRPWVAKLMDGDLDEFMAHEEAQAQRQKRENRKISAIGALPQVEAIWRDFEQASQAYALALKSAANAAPEAESDGLPAAPVPPDQLLASQGILPPRVTDMLKELGIDVPIVEEQDNDSIHLLWLDDWRVSDAYDNLPEIIKQVAREHARDHREKMGQGLGAMAGALAQPGAPQGSQPAEKGEPSQPRKAAPSGGQPLPMTMGGI